MKVFRLFLIMTVLLVATSCAGYRSITRAVLRDTIFSVEPRVNGTVSVWMVHDDVGVYCTTNRAFGEIAEKLLKRIEYPPDVILEYASVNVGDPEYGNFVDLVGATGCGDESTTTRYKIISITPVVPIED